MQALFLRQDKAVQDEAIGDLPELPIPVTYPGYASATLLPLQGPDYRAEVKQVQGAECCFSVVACELRKAAPSNSSGVRLAA